MPGAASRWLLIDLHELTAPDALVQLTRLLTNLPPHVHVILTTRHDARLRLHQLRLAGELAELRAADLRFSERETSELLHASGIALSEAGTALLHQRTEGWAAGLRLAASAAGQGWSPTRAIARVSGTPSISRLVIVAARAPRVPFDRSLSAMANTAP